MMHNEIDFFVNAFEQIGADVGLSGKTVRKAMCRGAVTGKTARKLAKRLCVDIDVFKIKPDGRGNPDFKKLSLALMRRKKG